ncbi:hypothetical protein [Spongiactinospora sp. 9N601]|uniref:hypothetical protein n=1 Tax=Spongiactinospora sp. 9N601 TaxID=3375149 RepID=UPI0037A42F7C
MPVVRRSGASAGLATSHPFTDARSIAPHADLVVWEQDEERPARFAGEHPGARVVAVRRSCWRRGPTGSC